MRQALVGAGSVVTKDMPDYGLAYGNPAVLHGFVDAHGHKLERVSEEGDFVVAKNPVCNEIVKIPKTDWYKQK